MGSRPGEVALGSVASSYARFASQSGRGQPHSKTLARPPMRQKTRSVLECGCPLPLLSPPRKVMAILRHHTSLWKTGNR